MKMLVRRRRKNERNKACVYLNPEKCDGIILEMTRSNEKEANKFTFETREKFINALRSVKNGLLNNDEATAFIEVVTPDSDAPGAERSIKIYDGDSSRVIQ